MTDEQQDVRLDVTEPGGKYLAPDGKTFVDANGKPIDAKAEETSPAKGSGKTAKGKD